MISSLIQSDSVKGFICPLPAFLQRNLLIYHGKINILICSHISYEIEVLEYEAYFMIPYICQFILCILLYFLSIQKILSLIGKVKASHYVHQSGLTTSGWTDDPYDDSDAYVDEDSYDDAESYEDYGYEESYDDYGYEESYDDYDYVVTSNDTIDSDTISYVNFIDGTMPNVSEKRAVASWGTYVAMLAKLSGFEVTTVYHTILPVLLLLVAYLDFYYI